MNARIKLTNGEVVKVRATLKYQNGLGNHLPLPYAGNLEEGTKGRYVEDCDYLFPKWHDRPRSKRTIEAEVVGGKKVTKQWLNVRTVRWNDNEAW